MEKKIYDIIVRMFYSDKIKEYYDNRKEKVDFPVKLTFPPNFKVLSDFNDEYFNQYSYTLITNAVIYALESNNQKYLEFFNNHINDLKETIENEFMFRIKTTELAVMNISNKILAKHNIDNIIIENNKELFDNINELYINIEPLTIKYREIIMKLLECTDEEDVELTLDNFIFTDKLDKYLFELSDNLINKSNILLYKKLLIRLILSDNYLQLESILIEKEFDKNLDKLKKEYSVTEDNLDEYDNEEEECDLTDEEILDYIEKCIENNQYILPGDDNLRLKIYSNFIAYNLYDENRNYDIINIKSEEDKVLKLKKINPLYKIEKRKFN